MENYAVIYPIKPEYTRKIEALLKTKEVRTRLPKLKMPYTAFVYETKAKPDGQGKIVGWFRVSEILTMKYEHFESCDDETILELLKDLAIDKETLVKYLKGKDLKMLHINNYFPINPVSLEAIGIHYHPQSYIYISAKQAADIIRLSILPF
jgi:predicted transcriptional regulator